MTNKEILIFFRDSKINHVGVNKLKLHNFHFETRYCKRNENCPVNKYKTFVKTKPFEKQNSFDKCNNTIEYKNTNYITNERN